MEQITIESEYLEAEEMMLLDQLRNCDKINQDW